MMPVQQSNASNNTVVINQPTTSSAPAYRPPRFWTTGLCAMCDDMSVCCCVLFCKPCAGCQLATDMGEHCCVPCCVPGWLIVLRTMLRTQHNIRGTVMDDCCTVCCCSMCVHCQMMREVKAIRLAQAIQQQLSAKNRSERVHY